MYQSLLMPDMFSQAREVEIETWRAVPVQVDGEPLLVNPFKLTLRYHNCAPMLTKKKTSCKSFLGIFIELSK